MSNQQTKVVVPKNSSRQAKLKETPSPRALKQKKSSKAGETPFQREQDTPPSVGSLK